MENKFTPSFGSEPLYLAGRDKIIHSIATALKRGIGDPNASSLLVGARGTGKTVLLSYLGKQALQYGWITIQTVCAKGMLKDIYIQLQKKASEYIDKEEKKHLKGISVGQLFSVEWENEKEIDFGNWRERITNIVTALNAIDIGVLFTIDEVKPSVEEIRQFVIIYQYFVSDRKKTALLMAGLPFQVSQLLQNDDISFARRCQYKKLERISDGDAANAFEKTVISSGRTINEKALKLAVKESDGFPYMIQLVGYKMLEQHPETKDISYQDVESGAREAKRNMEDSIYRTTLRELSNGDISYLMAMLEDDGPSSTTDIAKRLNKQPGYAAQYRRRLLESGVLRSEKRGVVTFDLPGFKEFLKREYEENE